MTRARHCIGCRESDPARLVSFGRRRVICGECALRAVEVANPERFARMKVDMAYAVDLLNAVTTAAEAFKPPVVGREHAVAAFGRFESEWKRLIGEATAKHRKGTVDR